MSIEAFRQQTLVPGGDYSQQVVVDVPFSGRVRFCVLEAGGNDQVVRSESSESGIAGRIRHASLAAHRISPVEQPRQGSQDGKPSFCGRGDRSTEEMGQSGTDAT
jgi:hypothetical protein